MSETDLTLHMLGCNCLRCIGKICVCEKETFQRGMFRAMEIAKGQMMGAKAADDAEDRFFDSAIICVINAIKAEAEKVKD